MKTHSLKLAIIAVWACVALLCLLCITAPIIFRYIGHFNLFPYNSKLVVLISLYVCSVPSFFALIKLFMLLKNLSKDVIFDKKNVSLLSVISWCCVFVGVVTFAAGFWYYPLFVFTAAMTFLFLIIRVVATCFNVAIEIREENDLTI